MRKKETAIVTARMTPEVKRRLQERALDARMTLTDYLIICGLGQEIIQVKGLDAVLSELKAQGRNLNQLTTLANMGIVESLQTLQKAVAIRQVLEYIVLAKIHLSRTEVRREDARWQVFENVRTATSWWSPWAMTITASAGPLSRKR